MCQYQTLFHDDAVGYLVRCNSCENIQLCFGNVVMTFDESDFEIFLEWLRKFSAEHIPSGGPGDRNIFIPSPAEGVRLLLSYAELKELAAMVEAADSELRSLAMIRLFEAV